MNLDMQPSRCLISYNVIEPHCTRT